MLINSSKFRSVHLAVLSSHVMLLNGFTIISFTNGRTSLASFVGAFSAALKNSAGKLTLAGLVDTSGYSTAIAEKYQGFLITESKLTFESSTLDVGAYGFGFKDGKFFITNVAGSDIFSVASQKDDQAKHPVPLKIEKAEGGYRLYSGRNYVTFKTE